MAVDRNIPNAQRDLFDTGGSPSEKYARLIVGRPGLSALTTSVPLAFSILNPFLYLALK